MFASRFRVTILNLACAFGFEPCLREASKQFNAFLLNSKNPPHPDIRQIVYYYGMQGNGSDEVVWNKLWGVFINETDASEKLKLMDALSAAKEPWILRR